MNGVKKYKLIYNEYGKKISSKIQEFEFLSKKWQNKDLYFPFSDLDFRIVLNANNVDYFKINEDIYKIHLQLVKKDVRLSRIIEHPPGFIFSNEELLIFNKYNADVLYSSFCYGNGKNYKKIKRKCKKEFLYNVNIENNLYNILNKRYKKFSFDTEIKEAYYFDIRKYYVYCILWHYYFPCIFAIRCLKNKKICSKKISTLLLFDLSFIKLMSIIKIKRETTIDFTELINKIDKKIENKIIKDLMLNSNEDKKNKSQIECVGMLRTRVCRYKYYLSNELTFDTEYLIEREISETKNIFEELYKNNNIKNKEKILDIIKILYMQNISSKEKLELILQELYNNKEYFNYIMRGDFSEI